MEETIQPDGICWDCDEDAFAEVLFRETRTEMWWRCCCGRRWPVQPGDERAWKISPMVQESE